MKNYIVLAVLILSACGNTSSETAPAPTGIVEKETGKSTSAMMVANEKSKPECKTQGQLIYVIDIKEFQACDEHGSWQVVDVSNNTTTEINNTYTAQNVYTAPDGSKWVSFRTVQKSALFAGDICPEGYRIPTLAEFLYVALSTKFIASLVMANNNTALIFWVADGGHQTIGISGGNGVNQGYTASDTSPLVDFRSAVCVH